MLSKNNYGQKGCTDKLEFVEIYRCGEMIYFAKITFASPGYRNIANSFCTRIWLLGD